jgi:putative transposase
MPRIARGLGDGQIYHVINRGNGKQLVFHKAGDYRAFLDLILEARELHPIKLLAYCLMPDHFHFLLQPEKGEHLSKWMQWVMTSHVRRYHQHCSTSVSLTFLPCWYIVLAGLWPRGTQYNCPITP